ncbi:MAG: hypothetical protein J7M08_07615 [Planctomycetes bacterium]|nr:hypothetical protein [Planctomycetota bacterium]
MKRNLVMSLLALLAVGVAGCAYEQRIQTSQPGPPPWVAQMPEDSAQSKVFVGIALADNILDERNARQRAMEDVRTQIAQSIETLVVKEATDIVQERGAAHLGQDVDKSAYYAEARIKARQAMSGVELKAFYWEKWKQKTSFFKPGYTKYKYYVLAYMPRDQYEKLQQTVAGQIADEMLTPKAE